MERERERDSGLSRSAPDKLSRGEGGRHSIMPKTHSAPWPGFSKSRGMRERHLTAATYLEVYCTFQCGLHQDGYWICRINDFVEEKANREGGLGLSQLDEYTNRAKE